MLLSVEEIYRWGDTNSSKRNIVEGQRIVKAGHIIKCGKTSTEQNEVKLLAYCMQTSSLKQKPKTFRILVALFQANSKSTCSILLKKFLRATVYCPLQGK